MIRVYKVLNFIIKRFLQDKKFCAFIDNLKILPIIENEKFTFCYEVAGVECKQFNKIYLKIISGNSSFVDYLVFFQELEPKASDNPLYAIEETKTDDSESRNTGVYQRISKFVYLSYFYPNTKKIMLYNLSITQKAKPTQTSIFGTKLLRTLGVRLAGKEFDCYTLKPFENIAELIKFKANMRKAPKGNVPIEIKLVDSSFDVRECPLAEDDISIYTPNNKIQISARLIKNNALAHDPNIGAISGIAAALRKLGFSGKIEIIAHGLLQQHIKQKNKFLILANLLHLTLEGLSIPKIDMNKEYWHYEQKGEKLATIFIHLVAENFTGASAIFENHAGCEKGYFITSEGKPIALQKYEDKDLYKQGNKNARLFIPDLILLDIDNLEIINIEGKKYENKNQGIDELKNYDFIEKTYIAKHYEKYKIIRTVVLFGSNEEKVIEVEIGFLLNSKGKMILGIQAPKLFVYAIKNLLDFWKQA
ncbi:Uncharacterised protein [Helicobacter fennelliae]|uniref:Uncharacterized protein n=2 Tax=Helicobacter fennelliae TaxID=215 RepID=A0A2X3B6S0_9HELI|nr:Uncharacterised protein [Helicobacter fennelliae]STQ83364.1 Uncharacterised protein [Helicobacter fennelliae]